MGKLRKSHFFMHRDFRLSTFDFRPSRVARFAFVAFAAIVIGTGIVAFVPRSAFASTNISPNTTQHWAWNDALGWIDFYTPNTIMVSATGLTGYASSSAGDVSLDCHTTRIGNVCGTSNYQAVNDGAGNLSGWGWNDVIGWISFCGGLSTSNCPGTIHYQTYIDQYGNFQNYAWNDAVGWIDFNCDNIAGACNTSNYEVSDSWAPTSTTGYLDSTTFDTGSVSGAQLNSMSWSGSLPGGTAIGFQFAVSNSSSGPWSFIGSGGTSGTSYTASPNTPITLSYSLFSGFRYFRYRTILTSNPTQSATPRVDEVFVNWSP
jgi:hypothetical protein